jgi:hypothetical protein
MCESIEKYNLWDFTHLNSSRGDLEMIAVLEQDSQNPSLIFGSLRIDEDFLHLRHLDEDFGSVFFNCLCAGDECLRYSIMLVLAWREVSFGKGELHLGQLVSEVLEEKTHE